MIDIETQIFDEAAKVVLAEFPKAVVTSKDLDAPASFPAVSIVESNNSTDRRMNDSSDGEYAAALTYDVAVYSNLRSGSKAQARYMAGLVDAYLESRNFTRTFMRQGVLPTNSSVYRISARYTVGVTREGKLYRR